MSHCMKIVLNNHKNIYTGLFTERYDYSLNAMLCYSIERGIQGTLKPIAPGLPVTIPEGREMYGFSVVLSHK